MSNVVPFPGHKFHKCEENCFVCRGGLAACDVCGGGEGSLPTNCPGGWMDSDTQDAVYDGKLDFVYGYGWVRPTHSAWRRRL